MGAYVLLVTTVCPSVRLLRHAQALGSHVSKVRVSAGRGCPLRGGASGPRPRSFQSPSQMLSQITVPVFPSVSFPACPHLYQHLVLSGFLIFANLLDVKQHLIFLLCFLYYL